MRLQESERYISALLCDTNILVLVPLSMIARHNSAMAGEIDGLPQTIFHIEAAHLIALSKFFLGDSVRPDPRPSGNKLLPHLASGVVK